MLQEKPPLGIGFIGAGDISTLHIEGVQKCPTGRFVGLWSRPDCPIVPDPAAVAQRYGGRLFESAEALVANSDVDAVFVMTNYETHATYAKLAMSQGKHVLVEKPTAKCVQEIEELAEYAKIRNVVCMPCHNYIYEPSLWRTRQMIAEGRLGAIHYISIMYNIYHPEDICAKLPGVVKQIGTHHAYVALYLLGDDRPCELSAFRATLRDVSTGIADDRENLASVTLRTKSGAIVHLQFNFASDDHSADAWSFYIKVIGSKGSTRYSYNDWVVNEKALVHSHQYEPYPHTIHAVDSHFIERVIGRGEQPLSTLADAVMAQKIIDAAALSCHPHVESCPQSGEVVTCPVQGELEYVRAGRAPGVVQSAVVDARGDVVFTLQFEDGCHKTVVGEAVMQAILDSKSALPR